MKPPCELTSIDKYRSQSGLTTQLCESQNQFRLFGSMTCATLGGGNCALTEPTRNLALADFRPVSKLVTAETRTRNPSFPVFDAHNHLGAFGGGWDSRPVASLLERLDEAGVTHYVDLDGGWGEEVLDHRIKHFKEAAPDRFILFGCPNWHLWPSAGNNFAEIAAKRLRAQVSRGAEGLKIWKDFGLKVKDQNGRLVAIDDARLDPLWATVAELRIPVMIHIADPVAFFDVLDENNERWEELRAHPDWQFPSPDYPAFGELIEAFSRLVQKWPGITFIGAHVGCYAENLGWVSKLLDRCPSLMIDFSARISELGRQPYSAKRFFQRYADRILFGIDCGPHLDTYRTYYRFLETDDEYFSYSADGIPGQGRWQIYGLGLAKPVLERIYNKNAAALFKRTVL
jgi:predicted TIM-barrel fold metal-dependent hydrolase